MSIEVNLKPTESTRAELAAKGIKVLLPQKARYQWTIIYFSKRLMWEQLEFKYYPTKEAAQKHIAELCKFPQYRNGDE